MKKRVLAWLLVLAMMSTMIPAAFANAAGEKLSGLNASASRSSARKDVTLYSRTENAELKSRGVGKVGVGIVGPEKEEQTVTFNANGGSVLVTSKSVVYDRPYGELPTPTRTGYRFMEWNISQDGTGTAVLADTPVSVKNDHTLYAQWALEVFVSFDANDGSAVTPEGKYVCLDQAYGELPPPPPYRLHI